VGARGPVPKRSSERRRRNKESKPTKAKAGKPKAAPKAKAKPDQVADVIEIPGRRPAKKTWHPIAREWYDSLADSGQNEFYEASDWAAAFYVAEVMSRHLQAKRLSAQLFGSIWTAMSELLTTEGARRRARIELEREAGGEEQPAGVTAISDYRKRVGADR
jgi:hypothetical protein